MPLFLDQQSRDELKLSRECSVTMGDRCAAAYVFLARSCAAKSKISLEPIARLVQPLPADR